jgi:predicted NUDIX family NTP pyrophosphohydrolase
MDFFSGFPSPVWAIAVAAGSFRCFRGNMGGVDRRNSVPKLSAGILMFRRREAALQVLLVHPGGPFWKNKDAGAWSIPKGEYGNGEDPLAAAKREMLEETGIEFAASSCHWGRSRRRAQKW